MIFVNHINSFVEFKSIDVHKSPFIATLRFSFCHSSMQSHKVPTSLS